MTDHTDTEPTDALDELEPETVEDLDADEDATDVHGGPHITTANCATN